MQAANNASSVYQRLRAKTSGAESQPGSLNFSDSLQLQNHKSWHDKETLGVRLAANDPQDVLLCVGQPRQSPNSTISQSRCRLFLPDQHIISAMSWLAHAKCMPCCLARGWTIHSLQYWWARKRDSNVQMLYKKVAYRKLPLCCADISCRFAGFCHLHVSFVCIMYCLGQGKATMTLQLWGKLQIPAYLCLWTHVWLRLVQCIVGIVGS